ncbi:MAG: putative glycoside hydrolase [Acidimicrobiia bacterium]
MKQRPFTALVSMVALVVTGCTGMNGFGPSDAVIPPERGDPTLRIVVLAADDLGELPSTVILDGAVLPGSGGTREIPWRREPIEVSVAASGFHPLDHRIERYPEGGVVEFRLEPVVLTGRITTHDGRPLPGALVELGGDSDRTDNEGRYALERATEGTMTLSRPAWQTRTYDWDGTILEVDIPMERFDIRAIRASAADLGDSAAWDRMLDLADRTAINAVVIDLKDENGAVVYGSTLARAASIGAINSYFDATTVVADAKEHDLYTIGRIGVFQDDFYATAEPDHAVTTTTGELWRASNGHGWVDPSDPAGYEYSVALAEEACLLGFDEIQFDYVSWPIGDLDNAVFDGEYNQEVRVASITAFLERAYTVLHPRCAVSTTVLGIVLESGTDEGVGQEPSAMSGAVDVLSPTLYTTNYGAGWKGMDDPNDHAVEVVTTALDGGASKLVGFAYLRPWLQTWAISETDQRAVQSAVSNDGMGWLLWSNNAQYTMGNLPSG